MGPRDFTGKLSPINERLLLILVATVPFEGERLASTTIDAVANIRKESPASEKAAADLGSSRLEST